MSLYEGRGQNQVQHLLKRFAYLVSTVLQMLYIL